MIRGYAIEGGRLRPVPDPLADSDAVVWFDLLSPAAEEEVAVERLVGIDVPTLDEMAEIEDSSRLYARRRRRLPHRDAGDREPTPGIRSRRRSPSSSSAIGSSPCATTRRGPSRPFRSGRSGSTSGAATARPCCSALLDAIVERLADLLELAGQKIEALSREVFSRGSDDKGAQDFRGVLQGVGGQADVISHVLASLVTLERLVAFLSAARGGIASDKEARSRLKSLARDTRFLTDHANFLSQKITFLLDATLGMISIQQNAIIKIFSVAAVIFLPPTLVASIYGMNFSVMPELHWAFGYPMAILLMIGSAVGSYWVFKTRGWL